MSWANKRNVHFLFVRPAIPHPARHSDRVAGITTSPATTRTRNFLPLYFIIIIFFYIYIIITSIDVYECVSLAHRVCECRILYSHSHYTIVNYGNHKQEGGLGGIVSPKSAAAAAATDGPL